MREPWLRTNGRALTGLAIVTVLIVMLTLLAAWACSLWGWVWPARVTALGAVGFAIAMAALIYRLGRPRLTYRSGRLEVRMHLFGVERVPIQFVECFFRGHAPSMMHGPDGRDPETATVVVRLAERETQWHQRPTFQLLGDWHDGYIVVRGTWCEPLTHERMTELNQRLVAVHREIREGSVEASP